MRKIIILMALLCLFFVFQAVFAQIDPDPYVRPQAIEGLVYNGAYQDVYKPGSNLENSVEYTFYYRFAGTQDWGEPNRIIQMKFPGTWIIEWRAVSADKKLEEQESQYLTIEIDQIEAPQAKEGLVYDPKKPNDQQFLIDPEHRGYAIKPDQYYWRLSEDDDWMPLTETNQPVGTEPKTYTIYYILWTQDTPEKERKGFELKATIAEINPNPNPNPNVRPSANRSFYRLGDGSDLFTEGLTLPATGFPTRFNKPLSIQPEDISYESLAMRIQIPVINVDVELTGVPEVGSSWAVEWLDNRAGLLSRSAMPGEGYAMIAAHNHLNAEEIGPFALLFSLEENDRIFVNTPEGGLQIYSVYANELLEPDDVKAMASIAQKENNSLILVTCENEMVDGGYMNRRTIFAKPVASL